MILRPIEIDESVMIFPYHWPQGVTARRLGRVIGSKPGRPQNGDELLYIVAVDDGTVGQYYRLELVPLTGP